MPRTSQIEQFYTSILAGQTVTVNVESAKDFETIRVSLHRYHRLVREIGGSELSLLANLNGQEASFRLGPRKRPARQWEFRIEENGTQV